MILNIMIIQKLILILCLNIIKILQNLLYYNKNYFYKKGYIIDIINDDTKENLIESKKVEIKENNNCYLTIICNKELLDDGTKIRIYFKAIENNY